MMIMKTQIMYRQFTWQDIYWRMLMYVKQIYILIIQQLCVSMNMRLIILEYQERLQMTGVFKQKMGILRSF